MTFARPMLLWLALLLPGLIGAGLYLYARRRQRVARALGGHAMGLRLGAGDLARFPAARLGLLGLAAASLGFALAGPRWGLAPEQGHTRALDIVLSLDVSNSMRVRDVDPSRLARERLLASRLLRELDGDRMGLVAFAGEGYVLSPLTVDHSALQLYIDALDPGLLSAGGTALSAGIRQATDLVRGDDDATGHHVVVLVSDGGALQPTAQVIQAAERAARAGVVVNTVGIGTAAGGRVPDVNEATGQVKGWMHDVDGSIVVAKLNAPLLRRIAKITGGTYVHLGEAGATDRLVSALKRMQSGVRDAAGQRLVARDRSGWFIAFALLMLLADAVLARDEATRGGWKIRLPRRASERGAA